MRTTSLKKVILTIGFALSNAWFMRADRVFDPNCYKDCGCNSLVSTWDRDCTAGSGACHVATCDATCTGCGYTDPHTDWCSQTSQYYFCY